MALQQNCKASFEISKPRRSDNRHRHINNTLCLAIFDLFFWLECKRTIRLARSSRTVAFAATKVMPKRSRRKSVPIPSGSRSWRPITSKRVARQVTSQFHALTHDLERARTSGASTAKLESELEEMGGRHRYQKASALTTEQNRSTARFTTGCIERLGRRPGRGAAPLAMLEVGAVNTQLLSIPWLNCRSVDLHSIDPRIEQRDFFEIPPTGALDILVNGMVINCVESAVRRGEMLLRCRAHLRVGGLLVIVLPRRCVVRSKFTTEKSFEGCLRTLGFELKERRDSPKIAFWCFEKLALKPTQKHHVKKSAVVDDAEKEEEAQTAAAAAAAEEAETEAAAEMTSAPWVPLSIYAELARRFPHPKPKPKKFSHGKSGKKKLTNDFALSFPDASNE